MHMTRPRVLVVDDERLIGEAIRYALAAEYEVVLALGVRAAVRLLGEPPGFAAVICDLQLPDGTGLDVLAALHGQSTDGARRFAFMSGGVADHQLMDAVEASGAELLIKPFDLDALPRLVATLVAG
jgi:DNA-binding NtrC family response regulator